MYLRSLLKFQFIPISILNTIRRYHTLYTRPLNKWKSDPLLVLMIHKFIKFYFTLDTYCLS